MGTLKCREVTGKESQRRGGSPEQLLLGLIRIFGVSEVSVPKAIASGVPNKDSKAYATVNTAHKWHLGV